MRLLVVFSVIVAVCFYAFTAAGADATLPPSISAQEMHGGRYRVTFTFTAPDVTEAFVVGTFNEWNRAQDKMTSAPGGVFTATVEMSEGDHEYSFYVDNRGYRSDPLNSNKVGDPVRGSNSAFRLGAPKDAASDELSAKAREFVAQNSGDEPRLFPRRTRVQSVDVTSTGVTVVLSSEAVHNSWRTQSAEQLLAGLRDVLSTETVSVRVGGRDLTEYITPLFTSPIKPREGPTTAPPTLAAPLRRNASSPLPAPSRGLANRNIVIWPSHGWLYDNRNRQRWEWQRPRMFTTVEDMLPMSIVNQFLLPMLENAGAVVFNCRERDTQVHEVVVDNEDGTSPTVGQFRATGGFKRSDRKGFRNGLAPYADGVMPHQQGVVHEASTVIGKSTATAQWTPRIPADGDYAVYVSYAGGPENTTAAQYIVHHAGGSTTMLVNQQMAGNTWVYLGNFRFNAGESAASGSVELTNQNSSQRDLRITADAVKFGGGMGDIQRNGQLSGYPRYLEAARYWLQYCGIDPKLIYAYGRLAGNEYTEDYVSRAEYVNYLLGAPRGPNVNRNFPGLNVPVDLSVALHTDAGITTGITGTLSIHTIRDDERSDKYPDGRSRILNRDFADIIQTQIVDDMRALFSTQWKRRQLMDRSYAESRLPNVPAVLVELLSHQNYDDMKFGLDPRFRFAVGRAMYKGILRFLAAEYGYDPLITPLAPDHLQVQAAGAGKVRVSWSAVQDPLESTAKPDGYIVYRRQLSGGFDNGTLVQDTSVELTVPDPESIYSFRVTAYNSGGESFPSEVLPVRTGNTGEKRALIVNAFDRLSGPLMVTDSNEHQGAHRAADRGVGYHWNSGLAGDQFDFNRAHAWLGDDTPFTNDNPGHGASHADMETTQELGNTYDFAARHGEAFAECGWAFDSASDEVVESTPTLLHSYKVVDWLLGEERTTLPPPAHDGQTGVADKMKPEFHVWPPSHQKAVADYLTSGGRLIASGAYVASDAAIAPNGTALDREFLSGTLRCVYVSNRASKTNVLVPSATEGPFKGMAAFNISAGPGEDGVYVVENPGGIEGLPKQPPAVLRYRDGLIGAAVGSIEGGGRRLVFGFPLECVVGADARRELLSRSLDYLEKK